MEPNQHMNSQPAPEHQLPIAPVRPGFTRPRLVQLAGATLLAVGLATDAVGASFDCTRAGTRVEKMICADAELSRLDSELGALYGDLRRNAGSNEAALKRDQRTWLKERNACTDSACLAQAYRERIGQLGGDPAPGSAGPTAAGGADPMGEPKTRRTDSEVRITQQGPAFEIDASYPRLKGKHSQAAEAVLAGVVGERVEDFRRNYRELLTGGDGAHQGPPWELEISADAPYTAARFWAVPLGMYFYTGGAHGGTEHLPMVIDRRTGKQVPPAGLFRPGNNWRQALSDYSYKTLARQETFRGGEDWLREGTEPTAENYQKLLPLADGVHVIFEQYQVGPYAIGSHEVSVPYAELRGLLNPDLFPEQAAP